jgi:single-strand DNA-binding protein
MSINRVVLTGNLTRDPELRATAGGLNILSMRIAFNDRRKNSDTGAWEDVPNYIDVTMFGARGESLSRMLTKGMRIGVDGKLRWREWETQQGEKRNAIEVIADDIEFLDSRGGSGYGGSGSSGSASTSSGGSAADDLGEEIPF